MSNYKKTYSSPRIKVIQKVYSHLLNPGEKIDYPKSQYKKFIKDVVEGTLERQELIEDKIKEHLSGDINLKRTDKILKIIQTIEQKFGRIRIFKNMPRCIDLDIISFNENVKKSLLLTVPHPRMHLRKFVLLPLFELDANWVHPLLKKNIKFFLEQVKCQKIKKLKID